MFFKFNTTSSSQIDGLLAKEDVTLQEIMDCEDIISECRSQNKALIEFLLKPEIIEELVKLTVKEPSVEISENIRFKYPNVASELLTCDVPAINERLAGDERLLEILYQFLENEPPLNSLLASFFSKIMGGLIARKTEQNWLSYQLTCLQVLDFLKARESFLPLLLKHLGISAIMDLTLKLMTEVEGQEMCQNIFNWLDSQRIIQQLVCLLNSKVEREKQDNVAQLLCDFLRTARDNQRNSSERLEPHPLLNTLESADTINLILDQIFEKEKCESSISGGISILLCLMDSNQTNTSSGFRNASNLLLNSIYNSSVKNEAIDTENKPKVTNIVITTIIPRIKDFHELLLNPPKQLPIPTTIGNLDPPLGNARLQIVRLISSFVPTDNAALQEQLINLKTFNVLIDLFFKYSWNNFLHSQVENCFMKILEGTDSGDGFKFDTLSKHLIYDCELIERIMKGWIENDQQQAEKKAPRQGYMGHLISMFDFIMDIPDLIKNFKETKPDLVEDFDKFRETYTEVIDQQSKVLGGFHPNSLMEDNDQFGEPSFATSGALQQQDFSEYQVKNLPQLIDGYSGFSDDVFIDEDTLQTIDNPSDINFDLSESEMMQREAMFKQVCVQSINTLFDSDDQVFEDPDHTFQTVIERKDQADLGENSSDSDDSPRPEENMDIDPWGSPRNDPWNNSSDANDVVGSTESGWADFSSITFSQSAVSLPETNVNKKKSEKNNCDDEAASGDHPEKIIDVKPEELNNETQPSIPVGDVCPAVQTTPPAEVATTTTTVEKLSPERASSCKNNV